MIYIFEDCELDTNFYRLRRAGRDVILAPKVHHVLTYLLEHRDRVVSKQELTEQIWPEQFISNAAVERSIRLVRQATGDTGREQRLIKTHRGHGYRFVGTVTVHPEAHDEVAALERSSLEYTETQPLHNEIPYVSDIRSSTPKRCPNCGAESFPSAKYLFCASCGSLFVMHESPNDKKSSQILNKIDLEITIDREFDDFTQDNQEEFLKILKRFISDDNDIEIINTRRGSIKLTIRVSRQQAEQILWLYRRGILDDLGVLNTEIVADEAIKAIIEDKILCREFDVFLCHNNKDKIEVKKVGIELRKRAILPWIDEWELQPGIPWQPLIEEMIQKVKSAAIFIGADGIGPWQDIEVQSHLEELVKRQCPVIPVILSQCQEIPRFPGFLKLMTWVDFRQEHPDPIDQLAWGITGERVNF